MRVIAFTDIDDTLMATRRKTPFEPDLEVGAEFNGDVTSFRTRRQRKLWDILQSSSNVVVPVTARSYKTFSRVALPFTSDLVLDFGGSIYAPAEPNSGYSHMLDQGWHERMLSASADLRQELVFGALLWSVSAEHYVGKTERRIENGIECFVNMRTAAGEQHAALKQHVEEWLDSQCLGGLFTMHMTDVNVTVLPKFVNKADAVRYVIETRDYEDDMTLGLGDSLTDLPFMATADFMVMPSNSQAAKGARA